MQRYHFKTRYKGNYHCGWAKTKNLRQSGVSNRLDGSIREIVRNIPTNVVGSGRTDAGVHALAQPSQFDIIRQRKLNLKKYNNILKKTEQGTTPSILYKDKDNLDNTIRFFLNDISKQHQSIEVNPIFDNVFQHNHVYNQTESFIINTLKKNKTSLPSIQLSLLPEISSCFTQSCIKDEYKHLYKADVGPIVVLGSDISKSNEPQNQQKVQNDDILSLNREDMITNDAISRLPPIFSSQGVNLLHIQAPLPAINLEMIINQGLTIDFLKKNQKNTQLPNLHLSYLADIESDDDFDLSINKESGVLPSPPLLCGSIQVSDVSQQYPLWLPCHQSISQNELSNYEIAKDVELFPTHRHLSHVRFDAYKRQYCYRVYLPKDDIKKTPIKPRNETPYNKTTFWCGPAFDPFDSSLPNTHNFRNTLCISTGNNNNNNQKNIHDQNIITSYATNFHNNPSTAWNPCRSSLEFDISLAIKAALILTGKHNYNSFRNTECQADSPVRRIDNITFSFQPSPTQLTMLGFSHFIPNLHNPSGTIKPTIFSTQSPHNNKNLPPKISFIDSCRACIGDIIASIFHHHSEQSLLLLSKYSLEEHSIEAELYTKIKTRNLYNNDILLQSDIHYEHLLHNMTLFEELLALEKKISPCDAQFLLDIISTTNHKHAKLLENFNDQNNFQNDLDEFVNNVIQQRQKGTLGDILSIEFTARSYLHNQIRILTGAIIQAGFNQISLSTIKDLLENNNLENFEEEDLKKGKNKSSLNRRNNPCKTAPPSGLYLTNIFFPNDHNLHSNDTKQDGSDERVSSFYDPIHNIVLWRKLTALQRLL